MIYPEEFKARCKKVYPTFEMLHEALDNNSAWVGRYLCDSMNSGMKFSTVLSATSLEALQEEARRELEKRELYAEWYDKYKD